MTEAFAPLWPLPFAEAGTVVLRVEGKATALRHVRLFAASRPVSVGISCRLQFGEAGERKIRIVDVHVRFGGPLPEGRDVLASFEP